MTFSLSLPHLTIALIILGIAMLGLFVFVFLLRKRMRNIFVGQSDMDWDTAMENHLKRITALEEKIQLHENEITLMQKAMEGHIQKRSLLRFNSFAENSAQQSFVLVFLDKRDNGYVLTYLQLRDTTRFYIKEIQKGVALQKLSEEEEAALGTAMRM